MANTQNLMTPQELNARLTPEERSANARKAQEASAEAKRKKKDMRYFAQMVLDELVRDKKSGAEYPMRYALIKKVADATLKKGDYNSMKALAQLAGELPKDASNDVVINVIYNGVTKEAQDALDDL